MFQMWSEKNADAKKQLSPTLDLRDWDSLSREEKGKIWNYIKTWFEPDEHSGINVTVYVSVLKLNELHKFQSYGKATLKDQSPENARMDFERIFFEEHQNVVLELLSCFSYIVIKERAGKSDGIYRHNYSSDEQYKKIVSRWQWEEFDKFTDRLNDVFEHFGINLLLTRNGFIERQDSKISTDIYVPVLNFLSNSDLEPVNRDLKDAFAKYQLKTESGYSSCITHAVSALQAYLQILVHGKAGGTEGISSLIKQAQEKGLIPNDKFASEIFKNIDSILMGQRGKTGDAHPKQEYANEKNARLVLNLVMIFLQHCIQK